MISATWNRVDRSTTTLIFSKSNFGAPPRRAVVKSQVERLAFISVLKGTKQSRKLLFYSSESNVRKKILGQDSSRPPCSQFSVNYVICLGVDRSCLFIA